MEPDGPRLATPAQGTPQTPPPDPPSRLHLDILPQPDDSTCGPTCLHAVYRYFGDYVPLPVMVAEVPQLETGGTLASLLGLHALRRGYRARLARDRAASRPQGSCARAGSCGRKTLPVR